METEETSLAQTAPVERVANPFLPEASEHLNAGAVAIESNRAVAEAQAQMLIAKKFPRNRAEAAQHILDTCTREDFAQAALFAYPKGNKTVAGPSIRMAEEMARAWGNVKFGLKELAVYDDETEMYVYCIDMETNVISDQSFRSRHERKAGSSTSKLTDQRDIYENNANLGARRLRSRILAIMPPDLVAQAVAQVRLTIAGKGGDKPLSQKVPVLVRKFNSLGVTVAHLEKRVGCKLEDMLPDDYADLVAIFNSLTEGQSSASQWFSIPKTVAADEKAQAATELLSGKGKAKAEPATESPDAELTAKRERVAAALAGKLGDDKAVQAAHIKIVLGRSAPAHLLTLDECQSVLDSLATDS